MAINNGRMKSRPASDAEEEVLGRRGRLQYELGASRRSSGCEWLDSSTPEM